MATSHDRFYGTRAFALFCLIILGSIFLLYTWGATEAGAEENDPPPRPVPIRAISV